MTSSMYENVTAKKMIKIVLPSILMMILMSLYSIVDGIFVSRYVGSLALSAINIVYPVVSIIFAIGTMLATGGNAIVSRYLGEKRIDEARQSFSFFVSVGLIFSLIFVIISILFAKELSLALGASDLLLDYCVTYLKLMLFFSPVAMLQALFQSFFVTASRPSLGLKLSFIAGAMNVVLDYLFVARMNLGIAGAAIATGLGQMVPAIVGLILFTFSRETLYFVKFKTNWKVLFEACYNGSSEMITQLSSGVITFLFNIILMRLVGETGVAAITILFYAQFVFQAFYLGFSIGVAPIVGYKYGAKEKESLKHIYKSSFIFVIVSSLFITILAYFSTNPLVSIFTKEAATYTMATEGFRIFLLSFIFCGFNIVTSGFFTALSNGKVSAIISLCRTFIFMGASLILLAKYLGITGVWLSIPVEEVFSLGLCIVYHFIYFIKPTKKNYFINNDEE